ncbi:prepilin peptidase [Pseudonocardia oroxyli]|uniref:Type IV leader peptidase family protein n=1 Tax=Pseudonocardia oroxyli TaxID=366584 RepID=A0A1G7ICP1_PSEOR|nr:prepilin peptidase [Pseudonocardia oroxyli]SDF10274.1 Type IV leader peptidase family protein [Pseudonocardia oroxyli]
MDASGAVAAAGEWLSGREAWLAWALLGAGAGMLAGAVGRGLVGRLRRGTAIPPPWCEVTVGGLWAGVAAGAATAHVPLAWVPVLAGAAWLAVVAGVVDVRHHRLPDALTLPALPAALALVVPLGGSAVGRAAAGAVLLAMVHLLVHTVSPAALGLGDVKLAAPVGAVLAAGSWSALVLGCALAALFSGLLGATVGLRRLRRGRRHESAAAPGGDAGAEGGPVASARVAGAWRARPASRAPRAPSRLGPAAAGAEEGVGRVELPHGPSMLAAAWLTAAATAVGAGLTGPVGAVVAG